MVIAIPTVSLICTCGVGTRKWNVNLSFLQKFKDDAERIVKFYAESFDNLKANETVTSCFTDAVTKLVEEKLKDTKMMRVLAHKPKILDLCIKLVNKRWRIITENHRHVPNNENVLNFLVQWPPAATFIKILSKFPILPLLVNYCNKYDAIKKNNPCVGLPFFSLDRAHIVRFNLFL